MNVPSSKYSPIAVLPKIVVSANKKLEQPLTFTFISLRKLQLLNRINSCGIQYRLLELSIDSSTLMFELFSKPL